MKNEIHSPSPSKEISDDVSDSEVQTLSFLRKSTNFLLRYGVETHGIAPIPLERRLDKRLYQMFLVWFSANFNIIAFSAGSAGPAFFSLGVIDSIIVIIIVDIISCIIPSIFAVFGPKLGMRAMIQARYSWGFYWTIIPTVLNIFTMEGYLILNVIVGGQALASVSDGLNDTAGIIIVSILSLAVTFFGYKVVHRYESIAWIPNLVAFITMLAVSGQHLRPQNFPPHPPAKAAELLTFATVLAATVISWCTFTPDYGVYHSPDASSVRTFIYTFLGFLISSIPSHILGAAFAAIAPAIPEWETAYDGGNNIGGLFGATLRPVGGFGKFLVVLVALSVLTDCALCMYTFGNSFMALPAPVFARIPRYVFMTISTAILIPVAIVGQVRFYGTLVNIVSIIGYWSTTFSAIVMIEHFVFRSGDFSQYDLSAWNKPRQLPLGLAAVVAFAAAIGIIVPCMSQVWFVGPIAATGSGDIGLMTGFVVAGLVYLPLRKLERRFGP